MNGIDSDLWELVVKQFPDKKIKCQNNCESRDDRGPVWDDGTYAAIDAINVTIYGSHPNSFVPVVLKQFTIKKSLELVEVVTEPRNGSMEWLNALPAGTIIESSDGTYYYTKTKKGRFVHSRSQNHYSSYIVSINRERFQIKTVIPSSPSTGWASIDDVPPEAANGWLLLLNGSVRRIIGLSHHGISISSGNLNWCELHKFSWSTTHRGPWKECLLEGGAK